MSYKIELLAGENILLGRWNEDFVFQDEIEVYNRETLNLLNSLKTPVYFVHEFGNPGLSMQDIISGASIATKSEESTFRHKMIKQVIFITTNPALSIAANGFKYSFLWQCGCQGVQDSG